MEATCSPNGSRLLWVECSRAGVTQVHGRDTERPDLSPWGAWRGSGGVLQNGSVYLAHTARATCVSALLSVAADLSSLGDCVKNSLFYSVSHMRARSRSYVLRVCADRTHAHRRREPRRETTVLRTARRSHETRHSTHGRSKHAHHTHVHALLFESP